MFARILGSSSYASQFTFQRAYLDAVYGSLHPYGHDSVLHATTVSKIDVDDLESFEEHFHAGNATLIVVGGFDEKALEKHIRWTFGTWSKRKRTPRIELPPTERDGAVHVGVVSDDASSETVEVRVAFPVATPIDERHAARLVLSTMLNHRVEAVREKLGASYGVNASLTDHVAAGEHAVTGTVDAERAGESLAAIREAVASLREGSDFGWQFNAARRGVVQALLGEVNGSEALMSWLTFIAVYGLPTQYFDTLARKVASLTPDDVKRLAAEELAEARETVVLYGGRKDLEKAFSDAGIGSVTYVK